MSVLGNLQVKSQRKGSGTYSGVPSQSNRKFGTLFYSTKVRERTSYHNGGSLLGLTIPQTSPGSLTVGERVKE